jgi:formylglycine-generating enzyme required for sulfatase activity
MQLVDGAYCTEVEQRCLLEHPDDSRLEAANRRCLRYAEPSLCRNETRKLLRFCVDRYEWPNRAGEKPQVLARWTDASAACASVGKRLCSDEEWTFACEGEASLPYTHGYVRDPSRCVLDRLYVTPREPLKHWQACQQDARCRAAFARIDQREPSGSFERCVSPFGVYDMNGNANEWVTVTDAQYPRRGGLKGGWWGPVRDRCRPTVRFHREDDFGYEIGFRCCKDAAP